MKCRLALRLTGRLLDPLFNIGSGVVNRLLRIVLKLLYLIFGLDLVLRPFEARNWRKLGMLSGVRFALLRRLSAFDEVLCTANRAFLSCKQCCRRINLRAHDAIRRSGKALATELRSQRERRFHKRSPDGQRRLCAFEAELGVVVEADPYNTHDVWSITSKPAIARCAGLACRRLLRKPHGSRSRGSAPVQDILHDVGH